MTLRPRLAPLAGLLVPRPLAAAAGVLAITIACAGAYALTPERPPVAGTEALLDTPIPLLAGAPAPGAATAADRAYALGAQLERGLARQVVLARTGLASDELSIVFDPLSRPTASTPLADGAVGAARPRTPAQLVVGMPNPQLPLLALRASAPEPELAERLALAGVAALGALAAPAPGARASLVVRHLGPVRVRPGKRPPSAARLAACWGFACMGWLALLAGLAAYVRRRSGPARVAEATG